MVTPKEEFNHHYRSTYLIFKSKEMFIYNNPLLNTTFPVDHSSRHHYRQMCNNSTRDANLRWSGKLQQTMNKLYLNTIQHLKFIWYRILHLNPWWLGNEESTWTSKNGFTIFIPTKDTLKKPFRHPPPRASNLCLCGFIYSLMKSLCHNQSATEGNILWPLLDKIWIRRRGRHKGKYQKMVNQTSFLS